MDVTFGKDYLCEMYHTGKVAEQTVATICNIVELSNHYK